jgi:carbonic anhydrase/acetyltransferase-like protein (isoleucine patch superfamily)
MGMNKEDDLVIYDRWKKMNSQQRLKLDADYDGSAGGGGIYIGTGTNIPDGCIVLSDYDHTHIGNHVTVGHGASINSAVVQDFCLIGMGSILQPGSIVETGSFVAAGAVIGKNVTVKSGELWVGNPAKKLRNLSDKEIQRLKYQAEEYIKVATNQNHVMELGGNFPDDFLMQQQTQHYFITKGPVDDEDDKDKQSKNT